MSRWANPYSSTSSNSKKAELAEENRRRVQRSKVESKFLNGLNENFQLSHIKEVREELQAADAQPVVKARRQQKAALPVSAHSEGFHTLSEKMCDVEHLELTHGGATLWTASSRTSDIVILSGTECAPVHRIQTDHGRVTALHSTETHMWVGFEDGTVQVYDHLVFIHITEGTFHDGPVNAFVDLRDGRVFSAGSDKALVKWDSEQRNFEAMAKVISGHTGAITSLASMNDSLFSASLDGQIREFDAISCLLKRVRQGHENEVLAIAVVGEALFSGSTDESLRVWATESDELYAIHDCQAIVTCLVGDATSSRLWSGHGDGSVRIWMTAKEDSFAMVQCTQLPVPVKSLKAMCAIDTLKIWSLASNGVNKVWSSSINRVEEGMNRTIEAMKSVIAQDTIELDHWRELITRLKTVDNRRRLQISRALEQFHQLSLRRRFMWMWRRVMIAKRDHRRKVAVSDRLAVEHNKLFLRRYFSMYFRWYRASQRKRLKETYSRLLMSNSNKTVVQFYFAKMQAFTRHMKTAKKRKDLINLFGLNTQRGLARIMFRKWLKLTMQRRTAHRRYGYVSAVMRSSTQGLMRSYYIKWQGFYNRRELLARRGRFCQLMMSQVASSNRRYCYERWRAFLKKRKSLGRKKGVASCFLQNSQRGLMSLYFRKWQNFPTSKRTLAAQARHAEVEQELSMVHERYKELQQVIDERRAIDELEKQLELKRDEIAQKQLKLKQLRSQKESLFDELANQEEENRDKQRNMKEQLENVLARLKAKVLNFHLDFGLISQVRDKTKTIKVSNIFLEAHQNVKRVIVDLTHKPHLPTDQEWPVTAAMLQKIPSFHLTNLLQSIKTMIITFDMMDKATRDSLTTDQEIVINAQWLMLMADISNEHRRRTLGRGAARVR